MRKELLIKTLSDIKTTDEKVINLLIKSLNDFDYDIAYKTIYALSNMGEPAFKTITQLLPSSNNTLTQKRMLYTLEKIQPSEALIEYLKALPIPKNGVRFALEDAIERLETSYSEPR